MLLLWQSLHSSVYHFAFFADTAVLLGVTAESNPRSARVADITWELPMNTEFLDQIRVRFTSVPIVHMARRKRRASATAQSITVSSTATRAEITTAPFQLSWLLWMLSTLGMSVFL